MSGQREPGRWQRARYAVYRRTGLNNRKRRTVQRNLGYVGEAVTRRLRVLTGREQHIDFAGHDLALPPEHRLPYFLRRDAFYDVHPAELLAALARGVDRLVLIDVGANVGDTATSALTAADNISVTSVEGNATFAGYARRNLAAFGDRSVVIEAFVGPIRGLTTTYRMGAGGSGGFTGAPDAGGAIPIRWVSPEELVAGLGPADVTVWKSDIDGLDIHVLAEHWDAITAACEVVWFEYDPVSTLGDAADVARLVDRIGSSQRGMIVFDNLGNRMLAVPPGDAAAEVLRGLTGWLYAQREGHVMVRYFDVWLVTERWWSTLRDVGRSANPAVTTPDADRCQ